MWRNIYSGISQLQLYYWRKKGKAGAALESYAFKEIEVMEIQPSIRIQIIYGRGVSLEIEGSVSPGFIRQLAGCQAFIPIKGILPAPLVDMLKRIDGLCGTVRLISQENPLSGCVFIFFNKTRDKVRLLVWDGDGYVKYQCGWSEVGLKE